MRWMILVAMLAATTAYGQSVKPLRSIAFLTPEIACTTGDQLLPLDSAGNKFAPPAIPGAVPLGEAEEMPKRVIHIRKICLAHWVQKDDRFAYALVGHWGINGDHASAPVVGGGMQCTDFPADAPVVFSPGDYLDIHARCTKGRHSALLQLWFTETR